MIARFKIIGSERIKYVLKIKSDRIPVKIQFYSLGWDAIAILEALDTEEGKGIDTLPWFWP